MNIPAIDLNDLCKTGYYFCRSCEKITAPVQHDNGQPNSCWLCGSSSLRWCPPVPTTHTHVKRFTVQIVYDDSTRWLYRDSRVADSLKHLAATLITAMTDGSQPTVNVILEDQPSLQ